MDTVTLLTLLIIASILIIMFKKIRSTLDDVKGVRIPGPKPLPLLGNILDIDTASIHISFENMAKRYGAIFQVNLFGHTTVVINDGKLLKKVLARKPYGDIFNDRPDSFYAKYIAYDSSDMGSSKAGPKTQTMRKMFLNGLRLSGVVNEHFEHMTEMILKEFLEEISEINQSDFDINQIISKSVGNTTSCLLTGKPAEKNECKLIWQFIESVILLSEPGLAFIYGLVPFVRFLPGKLGNTFRAAKDARDRLIERYYFRIKDTFDNSGNEDSVGFVAALLKLQRAENIRQEKEFINEANMKGLVIDLVGAAAETAASALVNSFALFLEHKDVAKAIQAEIDKVVGRGRLPKSLDKNDMPYTMATVLEVLRYTSHVPLSIAHGALKNYSLEGYFVPKHAIVFPNLWYIHHDPKVWNDPWVFRPERFLDSDGQLLPREHKYMQNVLMFSTGQRKCPGENFGKSRMFLYIASLLQSFDLIPPSSGEIPDTDPRHYERGIIIKVKPFLCRAIPRV